MFQFSGFPSIHYGFMHGSQVLHLRGFPIRKSADRSLFAAPRSLSQLVTSFFGSWCQGIHLMLFLAWTSSFFQFSIGNKFTCSVCSFANFAWVSQIIDWLLSSLLKRPYYSPFLAHCSLPNLNRKDLIIIYWSYKIFSQLSVRFLLYFYSVFNEHFVCLMPFVSS